MSDPIPPLPSTPLPPIPFYDPTKLKPTTPTQRVFTSSDISSLRRSQALHHVLLVISHLSESVVGVYEPPNDVSPAVRGFTGVLEEMERWMDEIPLDQDPQRFGNKAFRVWGARLEERAQLLHEPLVPVGKRTVLPELLHHFVRSFGSFPRLDYGTGHELSYLTYITILLATGLLSPSTDLTSTTLVLYTAYLRLCRKLQAVYRLEPAGSKGVYGLDDHFHIVYILGSAQIRHHPKLRPSDLLSRNVLSSPSNAELLLPSSLLHIHALKRGPFAEHSPILNQVLSTVPNFGKLEKGMGKMWEGEVIGKEVVVQHWWLAGSDGVVRWCDEEGKEMASSVKGDDAGISEVGYRGTRVGAETGTKAPWAR